MPLKNICFFHKKTPLLAILLIGTLSLNTAWADSTAGTTPGSNSDSTADKTPEKIALQNNCNSALLQGAWQLESAIYLDMNGKTLAEIKNQSTKSRKLIAGRHFSFITWHKAESLRLLLPGLLAPTAAGIMNRWMPLLCRVYKTKFTIFSVNSAATAGCIKGWKTGC